MTRPDPVEQRRFAGDVVGQLPARGYQALWAGGCVRDKLLGRTPKDYDVVTDARPEQIRQVFGTRRTLAIGAAFGVITVLGPKTAGQVEVTTFRRDAEYRDGRHPEGIVFSSPREDAARRDFTINGMFYDPLAEQLIDFVGGAEDLGRRIVRAIGNPRERFAEDKLRMLRAVRFSALFDFELEATTEAAIQEMAPEIHVVSAERIAAEIESMLASSHRARAVELLHTTGLLAAILPEVAALADAAHSFQTLEEIPSLRRWAEMLLVLAALVEPTFALALAVLLSGVDDSRIAETVGRRWRLARKDFERTAWLLKQRDALHRARSLPWSQLQPVLVDPGCAELMAYGEALVATKLLDPAELAYCRERLALPPDKLDPPPLVTGQDLISLGIPRGNVYSRLIREVRNANWTRTSPTRSKLWRSSSNSLTPGTARVKRGLRLEATGLRYEETKRFRKRRFKPQGATGKQRLPVGTPIGPASTGRRCLPVAPEG